MINVITPTKHFLFWVVLPVFTYRKEKKSLYNSPTLAFDSSHAFNYGSGRVYVPNLVELRYYQYAFLL